MVHLVCLEAVGQAWNSNANNFIIDLADEHSAAKLQILPTVTGALVKVFLWVQLGLLNNWIIV